MPIIPFNHRINLQVSSCDAPDCCFQLLNQWNTVIALNPPLYLPRWCPPFGLSHCRVAVMRVSISTIDSQRALIVVDSDRLPSVA